MPHISDLRYDALRAQFPNIFHTNDLLFAWAESNGGVGNTLNDRIYSMLIAQGAPPLQVNDMWGFVLALQGFTGSLNDQLFQFWGAGGSFSGSLLDNLLLDDTNLDELLIDDTNPDDVLLIDGAPFIIPKTAAGYALGSTFPNPDHVTSPGTPRYDWEFRPDGLRVWTRWSAVVGGGNFKQYDVPVAWSMAAWSLVGNFTIGAPEERTFTWHDNGNRLTFLDRWFASNYRLISYDQSATPYDATILGAQTVATNISTGAFGIRIKTDGTVAYVEHGAGIVDAQTMTVPHDITTLVTSPIAVFDTTVDAGSRSTASFDFSNDELKMYSITLAGLLCSWDLTAPGDISAPFNFVTGVNVNLPTTLSIARGLRYRPDNGNILIEQDQTVTQQVRIFV